jgi:hypothetical protein
MECLVKAVVVVRLMAQMVVAVVSVAVTVAQAVGQH